MYANYLEIAKRIKQIEEELKRLEGIDAKWPQGELICAKNSKHYKWYLRKDNKKVYLPKKEKQLAQKLILKKYYRLRKKDLERELTACHAYAHKAERDGSLVEKMMSNAEYERLLGGRFRLIDRELENWMSSVYERNTGHPETLNIKGTQGKLLRSKSEAIIDKTLFTFGIPFRYEDKLTLGNMIFHPDFTIRHPQTGKFYYWEHFGKMDDTDYVNHICQKVKTYCSYGIIPSVNLILTYETKECPLGIDWVEKTVKDYFL